MNYKLQIFCLLTLIFLTNKFFAQPAASFLISRHKICSGSPVTLTNTSTGANSFEWQIDNIHFTYAYDTTFSPVENCYDGKSIKLIACDTVSGMCDIATEFIEVFDSCFFHWTADYFLCPGDTVELTTHPEAIITNWHIQPSHVLFAGCDTCSNISFILQQNGTLVDKHVTYDGGCSEITSFHYLCGLSNIMDLENNFQIFPNPADEILFLTTTFSNDADVIFRNIEGEIIYHDRIQHNKNFIDVRNLQNGFYLMTIIAPGIKTTRKVIVQHYR